jgi:hypothetical protein
MQWQNKTPAEKGRGRAARNYQIFRDEMSERNNINQRFAIA